MLTKKEKSLIELLKKNGISFKGTQKEIKDFLQWVYSDDLIKSYKNFLYLRNKTKPEFLKLIKNLKIRIEKISENTDKDVVKNIVLHLKMLMISLDENKDYRREMMGLKSLIEKHKSTYENTINKHKIIPYLRNTKVSIYCNHNPILDWLDELIKLIYHSEERYDLTILNLKEFISIVEWMVISTEIIAKNKG